jgi:hypothetical protein
MWVVKSTVRPLVAGQLRNELSGVLLPAELEWLLALGQVIRCAAGACRSTTCAVVMPAQQVQTWLVMPALYLPLSGSHVRPLAVYDKRCAGT